MRRPTWRHLAAAWGGVSAIAFFWTVNPTYAELMLVRDWLLALAVLVLVGLLSYALRLVPDIIEDRWRSFRLRRRW